jgi:hypothetical protein
MVEDCRGLDQEVFWVIVQARPAGQSGALRLSQTCNSGSPEKANRGGQENSGALGGPEDLNWATGPTAAGNRAKMPFGQPRA